MTKMPKFDSSEWFFEFEYNGETKRIHYFDHLPVTFAIAHAGNKENVQKILDDLLQEDCGLRLSDFDMQSMRVLIDALSHKGAESLGE